MIIAVIDYLYLRVGQWEDVNIIEPELLDEDVMEEEEPPVVAKKEKGKGRA